MEARKSVSLVKAEDDSAKTWPDEPQRFTLQDVDKYLLWCVKQNSSDISIQSERPAYNEIGGGLYPGTVRNMDAADMAVFLEKLYGPEAQARLASAHDLDVSYEIRPDRYTRIRFRVNITACLSRGRDGAQITMRTLPAEPPTMDDLGIEQEIRDAWAPRQGLVIITGPTGSGKSTLLASGNRMLLERPRGCGKMLTYEAPIEFVYDNISSPRSLVSQTEIPRHLPSFEEGVRNALRRKPEIILVGEARDRETINASIEAAQTGHAVYTTTHTLGVANTVQRMLSTYDMNEREERAIALVETLRLIVTQALVPRVGGGRCGVREWMKFPDEVREKLMDMHFTKWPNEIQRMIPQYGQTLERTAAKFFEEGVIDRRAYLLLSSSGGS
ncbi:MAG: ATPase [Alphaproteobacteria bacterium]|nr:ATPase [Alphaproteobacteria bacterium]